MASSVLVVGGGTGIGAAVARRMGADGWDVCVAGRRAEPLEQVASAVGGLAVSADITEPSGAGRAVDACLERFGRLDALVISSGAGAGGTALEQSHERWNEVIGVNLTGPFLLCQAALPALISAQGSIVTVSSLAGLRADPASVAYCTSKAGLIMFTQCVAVDFGPAGVRANCVCPGWVRTAMADAEMDSLAAARAIGRDEAYSVAAAHVPARRAAQPEEVAEAVVWLASTAASYVNGAVLTVDGGAAVVDVGTLAFGATNERRDHGP